MIEQNGQQPILRATDVRKEFGGLVAVNDLSFETYPHEIFAIIGPNGAGKTTTFNVISGIYPANGGTVEFQGRRVTGLEPHDVARLGLTRTFQNVRLFGDMTVLENVMVGCHLKGRYGFWEAAFRVPSAMRQEDQIRERAMTCLELVGLAHSAHELASNLPFGRQRLVELARAIAPEPACLLLDEPGAGLTRGEVEALDDLIRQIRDEYGVTVVLVEHNMELVMGIADRVLVLNYGEKISEGTPEEVQADEQVIAAYLGDEAIRH